MDPHRSPRQLFETALHRFALSDALSALRATVHAGDPYGIRTHVAGVRGRSLRPLDQRAIFIPGLLVKGSATLTNGPFCVFHTLYPLLKKASGEGKRRIGKANPRVSPRAGSPLCWQDLLSRAASHQVFSAAVSLTSVFGMGTGVPSRQSLPTLSAVPHACAAAPKREPLWTL